jgi:hypothetical protein
MNKEETQEYVDGIFIVRASENLDEVPLAQRVPEMSQSVLWYKDRLQILSKTTRKL